MVTLEKEIAKIQSEIQKVQSCHCLLVKLVNYDELYAMGTRVDHIMTDLHKIISELCAKLNISGHSYIEYNKVLLIFPQTKEKIINQLVLQIYSTSQLYINKDSSESYMNCHIASVKFPEDCSNVQEIYSLLVGMLTNRKAHHYYHKYNSKFYDPNLLKKTNRNLNTLRQALVNKTVAFAYQPIVDRKTGEVPYYECLLRLVGEDSESTSIGSLICEAETKGLINVIDFTVLEMAIEELLKEPDISLSVNISNYGIIDDTLLERAEDLLKKYPIAERLIIEITETALNQDYDRTKLFIDRLHQYGCRFALDDFGAGFTSFKQLQNLPIDIIKIDGSYVRNITSNHQNKYFIEALVKISEELGIKTVAEFVENGEIAKFLIDIKIDGMQGNFFSPASSNRIT